MNSRNLRRKADEERIRELVQITADSESEEEVVYDAIRETRQRRISATSKTQKEEGETYINELKELGMYEEGMTLEQVQAILKVIAESKETAETEETLRSKYDEWEDTTDLEKTICVKEPQTPDTSVGSNQSLTGEVSQELFVDEATLRLGERSLPKDVNDSIETVPFCPSDDETMLCSPVNETELSNNDRECHSPDSPNSGPSSPVLTARTKIVSPKTNSLSKHVLELVHSDEEAQQKTAASAKSILKRKLSLSASPAAAISHPAKVVSSQPTSEVEESDVELDSTSSWNAKTLEKRLKKQANRPKHKVPYYRPLEKRVKLPKDYTNIIVQAFDEYFNLFAKFQKTLNAKPSWGNPVQAGYHQEGTLDVKTARGKRFNFKKYMNIINGENSESNGNTDSESDDFTSKKDTSLVVNAKNFKRPLNSPDPYEFDVQGESDNLVIESSPPSVPSTSCKKDPNDGKWLRATYKRQLKLDVKPKSTRQSNETEKSIPSNSNKCTSKPDLPGCASKKRKLMVKAPRSYDSNNTDEILEVITVSDEKLTATSDDDKELKGFLTRHRSANIALRSSKRDNEFSKPFSSDVIEDSDDDKKHENAEESSKKLVECPLCQQPYLETQISYHASKCQGKETKDDVKTSSNPSKNSCCCFMCKKWFPLCQYQAHVNECMKMRSSSPLTQKETDMLDGGKSETTVSKPTGSRLLDGLAYHDETSNSLDGVEKFHAAKHALKKPKLG